MPMLLLDIPGLPPTPELHAKSSFAKAQAAALPLTDIQADILYVHSASGMHSSPLTANLAVLA
jgi:hypothetical protein